MDSQQLYNLAYNSLLSLACEEGITASGRNEVYGCIFGRDSAITVLGILKAHEKRPALPLLEVARRSLLYLSKLQGTEVNIESGEEPGKFIHEFRPRDYERLLALEKPWFVYPDGVLRNFDSIDSTPLTLIAMYKYWIITGDKDFLSVVLPSVEQGLQWIVNYGDSDRDFLLEYTLPNERVHGGLVVQSWTDSHESLLDEHGNFPKYPIAPVEVQGYAWLALRLWADYFEEKNPELAKNLREFAANLKTKFNESFVFEENSKAYLAQALDGNKNQIRTVTANPLLTLWAAYRKDGTYETLLKNELISKIVDRAFMSDLFVKDAGLRTMSSLSPTYRPGPDSYHNGSFWPVLNGMAIEGLENVGLEDYAARLKIASLAPIAHFGSPIELYVKTDLGYDLFRSPSGQTSCLEQTWSAAALLNLSI